MLDSVQQITRESNQPTRHHEFKNLENVSKEVLLVDEQSIQSGGKSYPSLPDVAASKTNTASATKRR